MRILIVEDETLLRLGLKAQLEAPREGGAHQLHLATSYEEALAVIDREALDIALLDLNLGKHKEGGLKLLKHLREQYPETVAVMMTGVGDGKIVEECLRLGAADYVFKPFDPATIHPIITKAIIHHRLFRRSQTLRAQAGDRVVEKVELRSKSPAFLEVIEEAKRLAGKRLRALITGESGTGKEVMAQFIWSQENDSDRPFIPVHCGAISENLVESTLFGHVKGAFSGAVSDQKGSFELADGGDIFLDEVGTMPLAAQIKTLRALNSGEVIRVGSNSPRRFDFRVIAATNADLAKMVKEGTFREDVYFRLKEVELRLPALRERKEDIPDLIEHFLRKHGHPDKHLSKAALELCLSYSWPGNVRSLESAVKIAAETTDGHEVPETRLRRILGLDAKDQGPMLSRSVESSPLFSILAEDIEGRFHGLTEEAERAMIRYAMDKSKNETQAAKFLGLPRNSLIRRLGQWGGIKG